MTDATAWRVAGAIPDTGEPIVTDLIAHHHAGRGSRHACEHPYDWGPAEIHQGVAGWRLVSYGDDINGGYLEAWGPDLDAVRATFDRIATEIARGLTARMYPPPPAAAPACLYCHEPIGQDDHGDWYATATPNALNRYACTGTTDPTGVHQPA
jgi:hypothetical protein